MKTVFLFSGQGSHYYQMGSKLFTSNATFRRHMYGMNEMLKEGYGISVLNELYQDKNRLSDPFLSLRLTHPAIYMTQYALVKVLEEEGIVPDHLIGCSLGEFVAATVAGVFDERDALKLIMKQVEIVTNSCTEGRLIVVLQDQEVYYANAAIKDNSSIAAIYGPSQFVVAGETAPMELVKRFMKEKDILHQELMVQYGFHAAAVDRAGEAYRSFLATQVYRKPAIPVISGVTGLPYDSLPADYFWDVVRKPTHFADAIKTMEQLGGKGEELMYVDLGPSGSLANLIKYNVREGSRSKAFQVMTPFQQELKKLEEVKAYYTAHKKETVPRPVVKNEQLLAIVFPGQGSQKRGMGEGIFDRFPQLTQQASEILGYSVQELCTQDPNRHLNLTQYTQPALFVVNALSYLKLQEEEGIVPDFVAGHSLGEYNALFAAGAMDFGTGVKLVQKRGALMAGMKDGGMAAVKGLQEDEIGAIIEKNGLEGMDIANYNTHHQIVLSGPRELIIKSGHFFEAAGATLYYPLNVSGAFHSRYMLPARKEFEQFLASFSFSALKMPVVSNVEAKFYSPDIKTLLASQLTMPVRWTESISFLLEQGNVTFKETGPGDVLTKLIWSIQKNPKELVQ
jgi:trans-AT polyketide synthase/acyltransferase/oxidoreductase domain-containing protein